MNRINRQTRDAFIALVTTHLSGLDPADLGDAFAEFGQAPGEAGRQEILEALGLGVATVAYLVRELASEMERRDPGAPGGLYDVEEIWQGVVLMIESGFKPLEEEER